ncbi:hypothetical protein KA068_00365 [Candidatus Saccharibacteria bacterium]|nr:hypothetical protein [Candidatus Saccharibacteria bacterium]
MRRSNVKGIIAGGLMAASLTGCGGPNNNLEACPKGWDGPEVESIADVVGIYSAIGRMSIDESTSYFGSLKRETIEAFTDPGFDYRINGDEVGEVACKGEDGSDILNPSGVILMEAAKADSALSSEAEQLEAAITGDTGTTFPGGIVV